MRIATCCLGLQPMLPGVRDCTMKHRLRHDPRLRRSLTSASLAALERWVRAAYTRPAPGPLARVLDVAYTQAPVGFMRSPLRSFS
jgi:hypothetical protein